MTRLTNLSAGTTVAGVYESADSAIEYKYTQYLAVVSKVNVSDDTGAIDIFVKPYKGISNLESSMGREIKVYPPSPLPVVQSGSGMLAVPPLGALCFITEYIGKNYAFINTYLMPPNVNTTGTLKQLPAESGDFLLFTSGNTKATITLKQTGAISLTSGLLSGLFISDADRITSLTSQQLEINGYGYIFEHFSEDLENEQAAFLTTYCKLTDKVEDSGMSDWKIRDPEISDPSLIVFGSPVNVVTGTPSQYGIAATYAFNAPETRGLYTFDVRGAVFNPISNQKDFFSAYSIGYDTNDGSVLKFHSKKASLAAPEHYLYKIGADKEIYHMHVGRGQKNMPVSTWFIPLVDSMGAGKGVLADEYALGIEHSSTSEYLWAEKLHKHDLISPKFDHEYKLYEYSDAILLKNSINYENTPESLRLSTNFTKSGEYTHKIDLKGPGKEANYSQEISYTTYTELYDINGKSSYNFTSDATAHVYNYDISGVKSLIKADKDGLELKWQDFSIKLSSKGIELVAGNAKLSINAGKSIKLTAGSPASTLDIDAAVLVNGQAVVYATFLDLLLQNAATFGMGVPPGSPVPIFPKLLALLTPKISAPGGNSTTAATSFKSK
jgi:hypothetical protein